MYKLFCTVSTSKPLIGAFKISIAVGTLLNIINQWDLIVTGQRIQIGHAFLNYFIPFCVSLYSQVNIQIKSKKSDAN